MKLPILLFLQSTENPETFVQLISKKIKFHRKFLNEFLFRFRCGAISSGGNFGQSPTANNWVQQTAKTTNAEAPETSRLLIIKSRSAVHLTSSEISLNHPSGP
jgi:hypothetical protein